MVVFVTGVMTPYRNAYFLKEKLMFNFFLRFDFGYSGNERLRVMDDNFLMYRRVFKLFPLCGSPYFLI